jgi:hypothetical protein
LANMHLVPGAFFVLSWVQTPCKSVVSATCLDRVVGQ